MGWFNWFGKEQSPTVESKEVIEINGNNNLIHTEHLQHLENIAIALSVVAVILVIGVIAFVTCHCLRLMRNRQQIAVKKAIERRELQRVIAQGL